MNFVDVVSSTKCVPASGNVGKGDVRVWRRGIGAIVGINAGSGESTSITCVDGLAAGNQADYSCGNCTGKRGERFHGTRWGRAFGTAIHRGFA